jgi:adenylate cyclase
MDLAVSGQRERARHPLLLLALAPVVPQLLGSIFNIWYNSVVVQPLLGQGALRERFYLTIVVYNCLAYPAGVALWLWQVLSLREVLKKLRAALPIEEATLLRARRRAIHLPWLGAIISGLAWLLTIPVFLLSLASVPGPLPVGLAWHLPIAFCVSAFIAVTNTFFLIEVVTQWRLIPALFRQTRADRMPGVITLSLRGRGLLWAVSASVCPIISLLLLDFAPAAPGTDARWFAAFVGAVGIVFGLGTALLVSRLVANPVDQLRAAAQAIAAGNYTVQLPVTRADEFGFLLGEFNQMARELEEKERLRETFGLHVGKLAAEQILARDPGLGGTEQEISVMFVDLRSFTALADTKTPRETLEILNEFLRMTVRIVEEDRGGMINKYLGDGFMALFGVGSESNPNKAAAEAYDAGRDILRALDALNASFIARRWPALAVGIAINSGPAIVGSIGSPERLEFTAIGATVNIAARLESLTKQVNSPLLLTASTRASLGEKPELLELPPVQIRGVEERLQVFALQIPAEAAK